MDNKDNNILCTDRKNMIIANNNVSDQAEGYKTYKALSYVSNGSRVDRLQMRFGSESNKPMYEKARCSHDRIKYIMAMEYASADTLIWTDHISLERSYNTSSERMRAIGKAYVLAESTMVILENEDVCILEKIVNTCKKFTVFHDNINKDLWIPTKDLTKEVSQKYYELVLEYGDMMEDATLIAQDAGEYSYWSRAWTMQELHMSNMVEYYRMSDDGLELIITSNDICKLAELTYGAYKIAGNHCAIYKTDLNDNGLKCSRFITDVCRFVSGAERQKLYMLVNRGSEASMESLLFTEVSTFIKTARSKQEFNQALCIALGIYTDDPKEQWLRILGKMVNNGLIPTKNATSFAFDDSWHPEISVKIKKDYSKITQYYSIAMTKTMKVAPQSKARVIITEKGSLVVKATLISISVTKIETISYTNILLQYGLGLLLKVNQERTKMLGTVYITFNKKNIGYSECKIEVIGKIKTNDKYNVLFLGADSMIVEITTHGHVIPLGFIRLKNDNVLISLASITKPTHYYVIKGPNGITGQYY